MLGQSLVSHSLILQAGHIWGQRFMGELVSLSLHWESCLAIGGDHFRFRNPHCQKPKLESLSCTHWSFPNPRSLASSRDDFPHSISIHFLAFIPWLSLYLIPPPHSSSHDLSYSIPSSHPQPITILFPLGPICLFSFFWSVECNVVMLYFIANIQLEVSTFHTSKCITH